MKKSFNCLTIMITNRCPIQCNHCGVNSGPHLNNIIDSKTISAVLNVAHDRLCQIVNFSGGEPFVAGEKIIEAIKNAKNNWLLTRVTTSGYWAGTKDKAFKQLEPMAKAGLNQLIISCSDHHQEIIPIRNIIYATQAARNFDITIYFDVCVTKSSKITSHFIRDTCEKENIAAPMIIESPLVPFGRASEKFVDDLIYLPDKNITSACPSIIQHPTIHANGEVTGCAAVFSNECRALILGNIYQTPFSDILDKMNNNPLVNWIHTFGPFSIKKIIEDNSPLVFDVRFVNMCHLCGLILNNSEAKSELKKIGLVP